MEEGRVFEILSYGREAELFLTAPVGRTTVNGFKLQ